MSFLYLVRLSLMKRSWLALALTLGLVFLDQLGLGRSDPCWPMCHGLLNLLTNRCLETPGDHNLDTKIADQLWHTTMSSPLHISTTMHHQYHVLVWHRWLPHHGDVPG
jgi:hypothetical protein